MLDLYTSAKYGPMKVATFNGSAGNAVRFYVTKPTGQERVLFAIRATKPVRILQGSSTVTASATTATYLAPNVHYPLCVETEEDAYVSLLGATTDAGELEISQVSDTSSWTLGPTGTGDSVTAAGGTTTLTDAAGYFISADIGKTIRITGSTNADNDGSFTILTVPAATQCTFANASGVTETSSFKYRVSA